MDRPILTLQKRTLDWILEFLNLICLAFLLIYPLLYFSDLPETIPTHFNLQGEPDGYGSKYGIWALPGTGFFVYLLIGLFRSIPHVLNVPVEITPNNAEIQYRLITRMLSWLSLLILLVFSILVFKEVRSGFDNTLTLGLFFPFLLGFGLLGILGGYIFLAFRNK